MASFQKYGKGWRVFVKRRGVSKSATFATKREAQDWAVRMENLILSADQQQVRKRTFREILRRYDDEVLDKKRSPQWTRNFIRRLERNPIADSSLDEEAVIAYRESRLKEVQGTTVNREMSVMSRICNVAMREWKWLDANPFVNVTKPRENPHRERRITQDEIDLLERVSGYKIPPETINQQVHHALLLSIETAMRAGEILSLTWGNVDMEKRTAFLPMTKNGSSRTVPLSARAVELLKQLPKTGDRCFHLDYISQYFNRLKARAGLHDLHFHDARHEAITRLSRRLDVLTLARVVGHKDIRQLMTYYNESAEDIAKRL